MPFRVRVVLGFAMIVCLVLVAGVSVAFAADTPRASLDAAAASYSAETSTGALAARMGVSDGHVVATAYVVAGMLQASGESPDVYRTDPGLIRTQAVIAGMQSQGTWDSFCNAVDLASSYGGYLWSKALSKNLFVLLAWKWSPHVIGDPLSAAAPGYSWTAAQWPGSFMSLSNTESVAAWANKDQRDWIMAVNRSSQYVTPWVVSRSETYNFSSGEPWYAVLSYGVTRVSERKAGGRSVDVAMEWTGYWIKGTGSVLFESTAMHVVGGSWYGWNGRFGGGGYQTIPSPSVCASWMAGWNRSDTATNTPLTQLGAGPWLNNVQKQPFPIPLGAKVDSSGRMIPDPSMPVWVPPDGLGDGAQGNSATSLRAIAAQLRSHSASLQADGGILAWLLGPVRILEDSAAGVLEWVADAWDWVQASWQWLSTPSPVVQGAVLDAIAADTKGLWELLLPPSVTDAWNGLLASRGTGGLPTSVNMTVMGAPIHMDLLQAAAPIGPYRWVGVAVIYGWGAVTIWRILLGFVDWGAYAGLDSAMRGDESD